MNPRIIENHFVFPAPTGLVLPFPAKSAQVRGETFCAVPVSLDAARVLTNLGIPVPSPIRTEYDWPGRFRPLAHQVHTAEFLTLNPRAFCLNGMGSMKTISSLWAADYLMKKGLLHRALILSPLSTLERVWGDEIFMNFPRRKFAVLHGTAAKRRELLAQPHDFYIINHDGIEIIAGELEKRTDINLIIIDEAAVYRNSQNKRWKVAKTLMTPERSVWGLTGTPTPNAPTDAYGLSKMIKPENYTGPFTRFKQDVMYQVSMFKWLPRKGAEEIVQRVLSPSIRYALTDCVDLPETIFQDREAQLSPSQKVHYDKLLKECVTEVGDSIITAVNAAVLVSKLVQAACGVMYAADGSTVEVDAGPRLTVLKEVIEECNEKIIIFVPLTGTLDMLHRELKKHWTCEVIDGGVSAGKRNEIFRKFQHEQNPRILIANPQTMSHGLTLTAASTIIWYAPIHSNETFAQANARIVRPGQKNVTNIVSIFATPAERRIYESLKNKGKLQDIVLELVKGKRKS